MPEHHHAKFGCNRTTNIGEAGGRGAQCALPPAYMVPKDTLCFLPFNIHETFTKNIQFSNASCSEITVMKLEIPNFPC